MTDTSSQGPATGDDRKVLTNRQGHPVYDNQNQRTVGSRGPATLENYQFLEKISHFDRERIPERVVHARGVTAYGYFEAYGTWGDEPISRYTRAKLFQEAGKRTDLAVRFSTVIGGRDSSEAARDPRGFAVKFYTEDGNWDLVGNNLGVFFIRDAIKFPDVIHALKPDPVTFEQQPRRIFDFMSQAPESMHMLVNLFSPRGIPADYRHMQGFGVNTYKWVDAEGNTKLVKYHWMPKQGVRSMTEEDAANVQAQGLGHATKDLYEAVERGDHPEWELLVQMMDDHEHPELDFDPLDDTKTWPEQDFPPKPVGKMVLNRMPPTSSPRTSRSPSAPASSSTAWTSPTTRCSSAGPSPTATPSATGSAPTTFSCRSTSPRARRCAPTSATARWPTTWTAGTTPTSTTSRPSWAVCGRPTTRRTTSRARRSAAGLTRKRIERTNDYLQAGQRYMLLEDWERDDLVKNFTDLLSQCDRPVQERMVWHFLLVENDLGRRVGEGLGIVPEDVAHLEPLEGQTLTEEDRKRLANLGDNPPRDVTGLTMTHCAPDERHVVTR